MIVIGLLLILAGAAAAVVAAMGGGGDQTSIEVFDYQIVGTAASFFFMGLGVMLAFVLGVWMFAAGAGRSAKRRRELKRLRRRAEAEPASAPVAEPAPAAAPAAAPAPARAKEPVTETTVAPAVPAQAGTETAAGAHRDSAKPTT